MARTKTMIAIQTVILAIGVGLAAALAGGSDWAIVILALIVAGITGGYAYWFGKQRENAKL